MKVGDYLSALLELWSVDVSENLINAELMNVDLTSDSEYDSEVEVKIDTLLYNLIPKLLSSIKSVSEGGFSITYDKEAMTLYYGLLSDKLGLPNSFMKNKIHDRSKLW